MNILFQEKCSLCRNKIIVSELDCFYEDDFIILDNGDKIPYPTQIKNKTIAKRYFKNQGWLYHKKQVFCDNCKEILFSGYVILDKYNHIFDDESANDRPTISCVMSDEKSKEMIKYEYNDEEVFRKKALPVICKFLNGEIKTNSIEYIKKHPDVHIIIDL